MNLDERIHEIHLAAYDFDSGKFAIDQAARSVKQLITDVLEYVKPKRDPVREDKEVTMGYNAGFIVAVDEMEAKQRELGLIE